LQNIDPVFFLTPIIVLGFSVGLVLYLRLRGRFSAWVLLTSLIAYGGAIALKVVFQTFTLRSFEAAVGGSQVALGAYFGLQTVIFEVGGAFLVARYAFSKGKIRADDAAAYGAGLAFWENGVLVGATLLLDYIVYTLVLSGGGAGAQQLFAILEKESPSLFYVPSEALPLVGYAVLERASSLLVHFSWGLLCVFAVVFRRRLFLWLALPMGLVDFLPPFSARLGIPAFEALLFGLSLLSLWVALASTTGARREIG
jgi:uncharacterized membrane protein YhfC